MEACIALDKICRSFTVEDVTEDPTRLSSAFDLVCEGYMQLTSRPLDLTEVREELCADPYHRHGLARTLLLTGENPNTGMIEPLGTLRIVLGYSHTAKLGIPPLEAMRLITPRGGWRDFSFEGFHVDEVVEGGRTAVAAACRIGLAKELQVAMGVVRTLYVEGYRLACRNYAKSQYWGILPSHIVSKAESAGFRFIPAPHITLNHEENGALFEKYDRYWLKSAPWFYKVLIPTS